MNHQEDPLEQLLDEQADSEFGMPQFKDQKQVLANWTAQDFSDIYVRFYPHLLRHAKRFLTNHAQAEEIVQDAFLYLMTSLPEIDSEIGVLKLLKWKVKNLAMDVISSNARASFASVDELEIPVDHELAENLVRADEAAIVSLALAKLPPRQREALIASLYEEKETTVIAGQLGLSENATRQLLFRAKATFKKALIGEAETAGLSVSQIISIAARKAAKESGKYLGVASAFLLVFAISVGVLPNLPSQEQTGAAAPISQEPIRVDDLERSESKSELEIEVLSPDESELNPVALSSSSTIPSTDATAAISFAAPVLSLGSSQAGFAYGFGADRDQLVRQLLIFTDQEFLVSVDIVRIGETYSYELSGPKARFELDGQVVTITGERFGASQIASEKGQTLTLVATDLSINEAVGGELPGQTLSGVTLTVHVELDLLGQVIGASAFLN